jgi:outer membrane protein
MRAVKSAYSIFFVLWFVIGAAGFSSAADVAKIGVVSIQKILQNSTVGKSIQVTLKKEGAKKEADLKTRQSEIENIRKRLERESMVMSREMRDEKERDLRIKINDFKTLQQKYTTEMQRMNSQLTQQILADIEQLIEEIGKKGGYLLIMDKRGVLYAPGSVDITDQLIQKLNAKAAKAKKP